MRGERALPRAALARGEDEDVHWVRSESARYAGCGNSPSSQRKKCGKCAMAYCKDGLANSASCRRLRIVVNNTKGGDPVSHCQSPRSPATAWILASFEVRAA